MLDENCSKHEGPMGDIQTGKVLLNDSALAPNPRKGGKRRE